MIGEIRIPGEGLNTSRQAAEGGVPYDTAPPRWGWPLNRHGRRR